MTTERRLPFDLVVEGDVLASAACEARWRPLVLGRCPAEVFVAHGVLHEAMVKSWRAGEFGVAPCGQRGERCWHGLDDADEARLQVLVDDAPIVRVGRSVAWLRLLAYRRRRALALDAAISSLLDIEAAAR